MAGSISLLASLGNGPRGVQGEGPEPAVIFAGLFSHSKYTPTFVPNIILHFCISLWRVSQRCVNSRSSPPNLDWTLILWFAHDCVTSSSWMRSWYFRNMYPMNRWFMKQAVFTAHVKANAFGGPSSETRSLTEERFPNVRLHSY